jgi:hypothetical protein
MLRDNAVDYENSNNISNKNRCVLCGALIVSHGLLLVVGIFTGLFICDIECSGNGSIG